MTYQGYDWTKLAERWGINAEDINELYDKTKHFILNRAKSVDDKLILDPKIKSDMCKFLERLKEGDKTEYKHIWDALLKISKYNDDRPFIRLFNKLLFDMCM